eukprot:scaffold6068_cov65-Attheya_sp.AAC.1
MSSFRIPTLEEARQKREASLRKNSPTSKSNPMMKNNASVIAQAPHLPAPAPAPVVATKKPVVNNPYAKTQRVTPVVPPSRSTKHPKSAATANRFNSIPVRTGGGGGKQGVTKSRGSLEGGTKDGIKPLEVMDVGPNATFSQAFGAVQDTDHYEKEITNSAIPIEIDPEQVEQRKFDIATATASTSTTTSTSARDRHALLQTNTHVLHVSTRQRGNGCLKYIRNVPMEYSKMVPDYIMGTNRCALFLSCKYHSLHPNYVHGRIAELGTDFDLRVLLCLVDVDDNTAALLLLNKVCVVNKITLILAWSEEEAGRYLETFKAFDGKDASSIQKREQTVFADQVADVLGSIRSVNKTDAAQLLSQFSSLRAVMAASMDELSLCPGMGEKKVRRLYDALHKPFSSRATLKRKQQKIITMEHSSLLIQNKKPTKEEAPTDIEDPNQHETEDNTS